MKNEPKIPKGYFLIKEPLKDHPLFMPPLVKSVILIKKGVSVNVPEILKQNMITEGVIKGETNVIN